MMKTPTLLAGAVLLLAGIGLSQIKNYTLDEMVAEADDAVHGVIVEREVFRVDHPVDGDELYFTTLTIEGRSLVTGQPQTVDITYHGGFLSEEEGVYNSEAPAADDVQLGNTVVAFYVWTDNMGGEVAANALLAAHGGLYRTLPGPRSMTVLGRGQGYAVGSNIRLSDLDVAVTRISENVRKAGK